MSRYLSISALADEVLATVVEEARAKTAAHAPAPVERAYTVPTARELRKLAEQLRDGIEDDEVMPEDLEALQNDAEVEELLRAIQANPELLAALMAEEGLEVPEAFDLGPDGAPDMAPQAAPPGEDPGVESAEDFAALADAAAAEEGGLPVDPTMPKAASAGRDLRKLAKDLRRTALLQRRTRLIKAAAMMNAAVGIQHLVGGRK